MKSQWLKTDATTAKRTATSLRKMAERLHSDIESRGVLLAAARIAERIADTTKKEAAQAKRDEDAHAAAIVKAKTQAEAKIRADWPLNTLTQKLALIRLDGKYALRHVVPYLSDPKPLRLSYDQLMQTLVDESFREVVSSIAYASVNKKTDVVTQICEFAREIEALAASAEVKAVADAIAPYFAPQQVAA